jgi:DNA-binding transcriptional regulator YiaG
MLLFTPAQCRAGRALIGLNQPGLATAADLGLSTVVDFERGRRKVSTAAEKAMRTALEAAGVIFLDPGDGKGPGVRLATDLL